MHVCVVSMLEWHGKMKCVLAVSFRLRFFHITGKVVLDPWVISCAGVGAG